MLKRTSIYVVQRYAFLVALCVASGGLSGYAKEPQGTPAVFIEGVDDSALHELLDALSASFWQGNRPPDSEVVLQGRARRHRDRLKQALASEGYYGGEVAFDIEWNTERKGVRFQVTPGEPYRVQTLETVFQETPETAPMPPPALQASLGLEVGAVARAQDILDAEKRLEGAMKNAGYPFARVHDRQVMVNHDTHTADITYFLALGRRMRFGKVVVEGLKQVKEETVLRELLWREKDVYREDAVTHTREQLQKTGLFSLVRVAPVELENADTDEVPMGISVTERRHRSISLGLQYRTDEGVGASGQWEHRNFLEQGRRLRLQSDITELEQHLSMSYDIQKFRRPDQTLTLNVKMAQLDPDAYRSRRIDVGAWLERALTPEWSVGMGPALRLSDVEQKRRNERFYLASFPMQISYDCRDDRMDPGEGYRVVNRMAPFIDVTRADIFFVKDELTLSHYFDVSFLPDLVVATRLRVGLMSGAGLGNIPADERYYAGGGGSIRGYAYQKVGPLDEDNDPTGGRSLTEWSLEIRKRILQNFGMVVFVDGGTAHENTYPDFSQAPLWGAGAGLRYFTPMGPLRLDVAVPLNRRHGIDSSMQFYISIGQAF